MKLKKVEMKPTKTKYENIQMKQLQIQQNEWNQMQTKT